MEPKEFDKWAREAVEQREDRAQLEAGYADTLWKQVREHQPKTYVDFWRAAAIILLFLGAAMAWYSTGLHADQNALYAQLQQANRQLRELAIETTEAKAMEASPVLIPEKEIVLVHDTIVQEIVKERIVYIDQPVQTASPTINADSLIAIIEEQQAALEQLETYAQVDEPKAYMSSFNVVFDNQETQTTKATSPKKEGGLRLNVSLFNKK